MLLPPIIALLTWPVVVIALFMNLPRQSAVLAGLLWSFLFLPEKFYIDIPLLPGLNKNSIPIFAILLCLFLFKEKFAGCDAQTNGPTLINEKPGFGRLLILLTVVMFLNEVMTVATNRELLAIGPRFIPGLGLSDLIRAMIDLVVLVTPFFLGRAFFKTPEDHRKLLQILVFAGLVYSLLILVEARLSPQLHNWVYGYHQHSFAQHVRGGYFRAKVFLDHGLSVGFFILMVVLAAAGMSRNKAYSGHVKWLIVCGFFFVVLFISRNLGAWAIAIMLLPLLWIRIGIQVSVAALVAILFVTYPATRQSNLVPLDQISAFSSGISEQRTESFMFRLRNEDILLARALEKPLFGWGGWGRNRVFNEAGSDISVTDGLWIIILGVSGWVGYVAVFGLLAAPLIMLVRIVRKRDIPPETAAIALITAANLIYLIPNSTLSPLTWLLTGALAGFIQYRKVARVPATEAISDVPHYTRFPYHPARAITLSAQPALPHKHRRKAPDQMMPARSSGQQP